MQTQLTLLPEDFPANHLAQPEKEKERKMNATSGKKCLEQLEKFNRLGLWVKMFSALLIGTGGWYSTKCKLIWKLRATKYSRMYCQLVPKTPLTGEIEFGLWLTTPTTGDSTGTGRSKKFKTGNKAPTPLELSII